MKPLYLAPTLLSLIPVGVDEMSCFGAHIHF